MGWPHSDVSQPGCPSNVTKVTMSLHGQIVAQVDSLDALRVPLGDFAVAIVARDLDMDLVVPPGKLAVPGPDCPEARRDVATSRSRSRRQDQRMRGTPAYSSC